MGWQDRPVNPSLLESFGKPNTLGGDKSIPCASVIAAVHWKMPGSMPLNATPTMVELQCAAQLLRIGDKEVSIGCATSMTTMLGEIHGKKARKILQQNLRPTQMLAHLEA